MNPISPINDHERKLLQDIMDLASENNAMLHKMLRAQRWSSFWKLMYWTIIIGSVFAGYYWVQPYIQPLMNAYAKAMSLLPK